MQGHRKNFIQKWGVKAANCVLAGGGIITVLMVPACAHSNLEATDQARALANAQTIKGQTETSPKHTTGNKKPKPKCRPEFKQIYQPPLKLGGAGRVISVSAGEVCEVKYYSPNMEDVKFKALNGEYVKFRACVELDPSNNKQVFLYECSNESLLKKRVLRAELHSQISSHIRDSLKKENMRGKESQMYVAGRVVYNRYCENAIALANEAVVDGDSDYNAPLNCSIEDTLKLVKVKIFHDVDEK